jgi:hypothetical protein
MVGAQVLAGGPGVGEQARPEVTGVSAVATVPVVPVVPTQSSEELMAIIARLQVQLRVQTANHPTGAPPPALF